MSRTLPSPRYRASRLDIYIQRTSSKLLLQGDPCLAHIGFNRPSNIYGAGEQSPATNDAAPSTKQVSKGEKISTEIMYDIKVSCTICSISMTCLSSNRPQLQEKSPKKLQFRKNLINKLDISSRPLAHCRFLIRIKKLPYDPYGKGFCRPNAAARTQSISDSLQHSLVHEMENFVDFLFELNAFRDGNKENCLAQLERSRQQPTMPLPPPNRFHREKRSVNTQSKS